MPPLTLDQLAHRHGWPHDFARLILETSRDLGHVEQDEHGYWHATAELERALGPALRELDPLGGGGPRSTLPSAPPPGDLSRIPEFRRGLPDE